MNTLNHISFEKNGNTWLGHIIGTSKEIKLAHNSLYNKGGTNSKTLDYVTANHATFWTTQGMMQKYLVTRNLDIILNETPEKFKGQVGGALAEARKLSAEDFEALSFDVDPRSFAAAIHEYQFNEVKEVQKVESLGNYLVAKARGV
tara:strand:+ start:199 stop:636 length:438 start_codon:yes stop_codon:yes gene_type:complete